MVAPDNQRLPAECGRSVVKRKTPFFYKGPYFPEIFFSNGELHII